MKYKKLFLVVAISTFCLSGLQAKWKKVFSLKDRHGPTSVMAQDGSIFVFDKDKQTITRYAEEEKLIYTFKAGESFLSMAPVNKNELWLLKYVMTSSRDLFGRPVIPRDHLGRPVTHKKQVVEKWYAPSGKRVGWKQMGRFFYTNENGRLLVGPDGNIYLSSPQFIYKWQDSNWKSIVESPIKPIVGFDVLANGLLWFCGVKFKPSPSALKFFVWYGKEPKSVGFLKIYETNSALLPGIGLMKMENETLYKRVEDIPSAVYREIKF